MPKNSLSYCRELLREHDRDRFLLSLFAPASCREALWALFAFNHEIAKTREVVSETQLGLIRLQWWRDEIAKIYSGEEVPDHEVLSALAVAVRTYDLPQEKFETLTYAREFDLEDVRPANLEGLINYADFTTTPLMKLAVQVSGSNPDVEPVQPIAINYALSGLLRSVVFHARQSRCYLPEDLMDQHSVKLNGLYNLKPAAGLSEVVREVVEAFVPGVKTQNKFLKALQALSHLYLRQIKSVNCDVMSSKLLVSPAFKELRVALATIFS